MLGNSCELKEATGLPAAASFKIAPQERLLSPLLRSWLEHTSLKGWTYQMLWFMSVRGSRPGFIYGELAAVSDVVDVSLANVLRMEVSDGIIAPGYEPEALEILKQKKKAGLVLKMDTDYEPPTLESRVFGIDWPEEKRLPINR